MSSIGFSIELPSTGGGGADPSALKKLSNLSDLSNITTARTNLGLGNVDNVSDLNKPVSTATQTAITTTSTQTLQIIYVRKGGNNATGDGTIRRPFLTIAYALSVIAAYADASSSKKYLIDIGAGQFAEASFVALPFVSYRGTSWLGTQISITGDMVTLDASWSTTTGTAVAEFADINFFNSAGFNLDFQTIGGVGKVSYISIHRCLVNGTVTYKGRTTLNDTLDIRSSELTSTATFTGGNHVQWTTKINGTAVYDVVSGTANIIAIMSGMYWRGNVTFAATGIYTNSPALQFCSCEGTMTFSGANCFPAADAVSLTANFVLNSGATMFYLTTFTDIGGTLPVNRGGTAQTSYTNGEILIGNTTGNTLAKATLTAGNGVIVTNGNGSITLSSLPYTERASGNSVGSISTTSSTYQDKVSITTGTLVSGATYKIDFSAVLLHATANTSSGFKIINVTDALDEYALTPLRSSIKGQKIPVSGFVTFVPGSTAARNFILQWNSTNNIDTISCFKAYLEFFRIA